jgi:nitrogen-specific signal transduction histidine kinase
VKTALLIASDEALRARLLRALADCSVFFARDDEDAFKALRLVDIDFVLRDCAVPAQDLDVFMDLLRQVAPDALAIAVGAPGELGGVADFVLPAAFTHRDLELALQQADERRQLVREVTALRGQGPAAPAAPASPEPSWEGQALTRVLRDFARAFAAGFDLPRVIEMILDAIGELVRPTRSALLMPEPAGRIYRIVAHRGLAPLIVESLRLHAADGLCRWLVAEGRPARLPDLVDPQVARELTLAQGIVAVPLLAHGDLVAVLVIGRPVFGTGYGRYQTETLFDLATHLATGIRDIELHNQLQGEKEFRERILEHMSNGVITIGCDQRVSIMNRRAEEILDLPAAAVVNHDLRALPSPLGDMLYETLASGRARPRGEIHLARRDLSLEVATYPVRGDDEAPLGAVLVFEDLTAVKRLAEERRRTEQLQLLARVVARIADEIKNPLVSINTFMELIQERYDDPAFRQEFSGVVGRDVRRLVQVFEKLAGLVSEGELHLAPVDAPAIADAVALAIAADEDLGKHTRVECSAEPHLPPVRADAAQLRKALLYLVRFLAHASAPPAAAVGIALGLADGGQAVGIAVTSHTAAISPARLKGLFDPVQMAQESLIDLGPAVSQRVIEAQGGQLRARPGQHEFGFDITLPVDPS